MNFSKEVMGVLETLDRSKADVPENWEDLANDEKVMYQVMEMNYMVKPLGDHLGVSKGIFPPSTQLEDDELKIIVEKILDVWAAYNYHADLPEGLPYRIAYEVLTSVWDEKVSSFPFGSFHFDFHDMDLEQYVKKSLDS